MAAQLLAGGAGADVQRSHSLLLTGTKSECQHLVGWLFTAAASPAPLQAAAAAQLDFGAEKSPLKSEGMYISAAFLCGAH